jgi:hypothetical protein
MRILVNLGIDPTKLVLVRKSLSLADDVEAKALDLATDMTVQGDGRTIDAIATTDDIDIEGEVILPNGCTMDDYFFKNRKVFCEHEKHKDMAVGYMRRADPFFRGGEQRGWRLQTYCYPNQLGNDVLMMAKNGGIGMSIGFFPIKRTKPTEEEIKKYGRGKSFSAVISQWHWMETSFTAIPANVACQSLGVVADKSASVIDNLLCKGLIARSSARAVGFPVQEGKRLVVRL